MGDPELYSIGAEMVAVCKAYVDLITKNEAIAKDPKATAEQREDAAIIASNTRFDLEWAVQYIELMRGYQQLYGFLTW